MLAGADPGGHKGASPPIPRTNTPMGTPLQYNDDCSITVHDDEKDDTEFKVESSSTAMETTDDGENIFFHV